MCVLWGGGEVKDVGGVSSAQMTPQCGRFVFFVFCALSLAFPFYPGGRAFLCGETDKGQLGGTPDTGPRQQPVLLTSPGLANITRISCGEYPACDTCARCARGWRDPTVFGGSLSLYRLLN